MPDAERESMGQKSEEKSGNRKGNEEGTQSQGRASLLQPEVESGAHSEDRNDTCLLSASERQSPVSLQGNGWGLPKWDGEFIGVSLHSLINKIKGRYMRITSQNVTPNHCQKNTPKNICSFLPFSEQLLEIAT